MGWIPPLNGIAMCQNGETYHHTKRKISMTEVCIIGVDLSALSQKIENGLPTSTELLLGAAVFLLRSAKPQ